MSQFTPEQLAYFYGFPAWAVALFGIAIAGMAITSIYIFVLTDGLSMIGTGGMVFTAVIWLIALSLFFYARATSKRGVLR